MKKRLWFLGSVFAMLLILAMWWICLHGHTSHIIGHGDSWNAPPVEINDTICRTMFGLGDREVPKDENWNQKTYSRQSEWLKNYLPPTKLGWVLFVIGFIQWFFLIRKFRTKTKQFAIGVKHMEIDSQIESVFNPGGFMFNLKYFNFFVYLQVGLAVLIFISNTLCVVISKRLKYFLYSEGIAFESLQLNIEYVFPGVLYLTATIISIYCLNKYIKICQSE